MRYSLFLNDDEYKELNDLAQKTGDGIIKAVKEQLVYDGSFWDGDITPSIYCFAINSIKKFDINSKLWRRMDALGRLQDPEFNQCLTRHTREFNHWMH